MMKVVPKNKTIYIGGRRYVEGDVLPPHIIFGVPILTESQVEEIESELIKASEEPRKSKRGRPKK